MSWGQLPGDNSFRMLDYNLGFIIVPGDENFTGFWLDYLIETDINDEYCLPDGRCSHKGSAGCSSRLISEMALPIRIRHRGAARMRLDHKRERKYDDHS